MTERANHNFSMSDGDFDMIAKLAKQEFGLNLLKGKKALIASRLSKRLSAKNIDSIPVYLENIVKKGDLEEKNHLITALTTNVTSFFREPHHFEYLTDHLSEKKSGESRIRLWSAGCSSGQEPYSMAMTTLDALGNSSHRDVKLLATDIDQKILETAQRGIYSKEVLESIPADKKKYTKDTADQTETFAMCETVRSLISFAQLNLIEQWPFKGPFDAIFCRNVTIYFDTETQKVLWQRFADMLCPGGILCIGHSERLSGPATSQLKNVGVTSYQKI